MHDELTAFFDIDAGVLADIVVLPANGNHEDGRIGGQSIKKRERRQIDGSVAVVGNHPGDRSRDNGLDQKKIELAGTVLGTFDQHGSPTGKPMSLFIIPAFAKQLSCLASAGYPPQS